MSGDQPFPAAPQHRDLTEGEQKALRDEAFDCHRAIKDGKAEAERAMWKVAEAVYRFHEGGMWALLGHETLEEWLAAPEVTMKRTQFFRLSKLYRDLAVVRQVPMSTLEKLDHSKVDEVRPAIMAGDVKIEEALSDASPNGLGVRDLRIKYKGEPDPTPGGDEQPRKAKVSANGHEPAPDIDLPESELRDEGTVAAERLIAALDGSEHVAFRRSWPKLSDEDRLDNAKRWLEAVVANG